MGDSESHGRTVRILLINRIIWHFTIA